MNDLSSFPNRANEAAFPIPVVEGPGNFVEAQFGLTKRELFAAMVMMGMCASESEASYWIDEQLAKRAVKRADALLAELSKGETP